MNSQSHLDKLNQISSLPESDELGSIIDLEAAKDIIDPLRIKGYPTQFRGLNDAIGGIKLKSFTVISAEQGMGKSLFALCISLKLADSGVKCLYYDMENGQELSVERLIRIRHQLDKKSLANTTADKIVEFAKEIPNIAYFSPFRLSRMLRDKQVSDDTYKLQDLILDSIRAKAKEGYKIFVIDPYSRVCEDAASTESFDEGVLAGRLSDITLELNIAIIAVHHLRKGNKSRYIKNASEADDKTYVMPSMEAVRGSSKIVDRATDVWGLVRFGSESSREQQALLMILKNRTGALKNLKIQYNPDTLTFYEVDNPFNSDLFKYLGGN